MRKKGKRVCQKALMQMIFLSTCITVEIPRSRVNSTQNIFHARHSIHVKRVELLSHDTSFGDMVVLADCIVSVMVVLTDCIGDMVVVVVLTDCIGGMVVLADCIVSMVVVLTDCIGGLVVLADCIVSVVVVLVVLLCWLTALLVWWLC